MQRALLSLFRHNSRPVGPDTVHERIRLRTLSNLRWLGVAGQIVTLAVVYGILDFDLPLGLCLAAISASIVMNLLMNWGPPLRGGTRHDPGLNQGLSQNRGRGLSRGRGLGQDRDSIIAASLGFDCLQLAALIYLTGGLENPFSVFFLVPAAIAAGALPPRYAVPVTGLTFILISLTAIFHWPLPWRAGEDLSLPPLFVTGVWFALTIALVFATIYAALVARQREDMHDALVATQMVLAREERLSALGGLAAAAAHELGTPLATIKVTAREMLEELKDTDHALLREDAALLVAQSVRCREILSQISLSEHERDQIHQVMTLEMLIEEAVAPLLDLSPNSLSITFDPPDTSAQIGSFPRRAEILYGLRNLAENALTYARSTVTIAAAGTATALEITISDDGPGFPPDIVGRLGEPFLGTRRARLKNRPGRAGGPSLSSPDRARQTIATHEQKKGMGLGFFIAKTLLTRTGATLTHGNRPVLPSPPEAVDDKAADRSYSGGTQRGAFVTIRWPLAQLRALDDR